MLFLYGCNRETKLTFTSENSAVSVVSWSCVGVGNDGGFCSSHITLAWAQLGSEQTPLRTASPKTDCLGANELDPE